MFNMMRLSATKLSAKYVATLESSRLFFVYFFGKGKAQSGPQSYQAREVYISSRPNVQTESWETDTMIPLIPQHMQHVIDGQVLELQLFIRWP